MERSLPATGGGQNSSGPGPLISVIVPTFNRAAYVRDAVVSVLAQTYHPVELIVVDDGSTDNTAAVLAAYRDDRRVTVLATENRGVAAARNAGLAVARGEFVAFLDSDDVLTPDGLALRLRACQRLPVGSAGVFSDYYRAFSGFDRDPVTFFGQSGFSAQLTGAEGFSECVDHGMGLHLLGDGFAQALAHSNLANLPGALLRRAAVLDVGGFDASLRQSEDWDLFLRLLGKYRLGCLTVPTAVVRFWVTGLTADRAGMLGSMLTILARNYRQFRGTETAVRIRRQIAESHFALAYEAYRRGHRLVLARHAFAALARGFPPGRPCALLLGASLPGSLRRHLQALNPYRGHGDFTAYNRVGGNAAGSARGSPCDVVRRPS